MQRQRQPPVDGVLSKQAIGRLLRIVDKHLDLDRKTKIRKLRSQHQQHLRRRYNAKRHLWRAKRSVALSRLLNKGERKSQAAAWMTLGKSRRNSAFR